MVPVRVEGFGNDGTGMICEYDGLRQMLLSIGTS